ncbi:MAG: hypothetical protein JST85_22115 [Acidobacteria bacterium]|nr:hypothetical protein [Acidobacteriota bacterium]
MNSCFAQIETALELRQQQNRPLLFFLRDDDVDENESTLRTLLEVCFGNETPINLAVIPGKLTTAGIALLIECVSANPNFVELSQHGWMHLNHEREGKKSEFGTSRSFDEQLADIAAGQSKMAKAFGQNWFPAFVPPWNCCTAATVTALDQLRFRVLSRDAGQPPFVNCQFTELPVSFDIIRWKGGAAFRSPEELAAELTQQINSQARIGMMLHHKVMNDAAFAWLDEFLQLLNQFSIVQRHTFQSLLRSNR